MTVPGKIIRNAAVALLIPILLLAVATIEAVKTKRFREWVKQKIVTATEQGTGGRVNIGSLTLDWKNLRAVITDFVIHGNEPASAPPFIRLGRIQLDIGVLTGGHLYQLTYLGVDRPEANIMTLPNGKSNVPTPKQGSNSNATALQTVVDMAIHRFDLTNGSLTLNLHKRPVNLSGDNLRTQLWFNPQQQSYRGQIALEPIYVVSGKNTPVKFALTLPVIVQRDRLDIKDGRLASADSQLVINASVGHLRDLQTSTHVAGRITLADLKQAGVLPATLDPHAPFSALDFDVDTNTSGNLIAVTGVHLSLGHTKLEASGRLRDPDGHNSLEFAGTFALDELSRLARLQSGPAGELTLNGTAALDSNNDYRVRARLDSSGMSLPAGTKPGARRINDVRLLSQVRLDPHRLDVRIERLSALGAEITAQASLKDFAAYTLESRLRGFDLRMIATALGQRAFSYSGIASGTMSAEGDLKKPASRVVSANSRISIVPGTRGIPVSGRLNIDYRGPSDDLNIRDSFVALPHTRIGLSGSMGNRLNLALETHDLNDLLAAVPASSQPPVALEPGGHATVDVTVMGRLSSPRVNGRIAANRFRVENRHFDGLALEARASSNGAQITKGRVSRGTMQTVFTGSVGLRDWIPAERSPISADAAVRDGDLADVMALAGRSNDGYSGSLNAAVHFSGTAANPLGWANLSVAAGMIQNEPFDQIQVQVTMADQLIALPVARITAGQARMQMTAEFHHPRDRFKTGTVSGRLQTNHMNLAQFRTLQQQMPNTSGEIGLQADGTASIADVNGATKFRLTNLTADASALGLQFHGQNYGDFKARARTEHDALQYAVVSDFAGSNIRVNGTTRLTPDYPTTADASIERLPVERVLAVAKRTDFPARGNLTCNVHFSGTARNPQGSLDLNLSNAALYQEPIDQLRADVTYSARSIELKKFALVAGGSRIEATANYDHSPENLRAGDLDFRVNTGKIDLRRIHNIQSRRPGLTGQLQLDADGKLTVNLSGMHILPHRLNANLSANGLAEQGKNLGDLTLTANTAGSRTNFALDSNLADAIIRGRGSATLAGGYPVNAEVAFQGAAWSRLQALTGPSGTSPSFEAIADGQATVSGPATKLAELRGSLKLTRVNLNSLVAGGSRGPVVIQNQGPIALEVDRGVARIVSLHLAGAGTDIQAHGAASFQGQGLDVSVNANSNLSVIKQLNRDMTASGNIVLAATARGSIDHPLVNGRLELHDASLAHPEFANSLSNANGIVQFNGSSASIQNLTAESGGGKITASGFVALRDTLRFGLRTTASHMRVAVQQGVSLTVDANMSLTGTPQGSLVSGMVTIDQIDYAPTSDFGTLLSRATPPVASSESPVLDQMKLDVQVRTSSATTVRSSLAESLQADANLRVRGTASNPGILGRINITEGQLAFFNSTYTVDAGTIAFYDPVRINPVLNLSLETQVKGVDVVLRVTGPIDNMKLSYTSDPPFQFQEIVALLATGKVPTSDPTLLANQPSEPSHTVAQLGESAIVSKALADPVSSQLQRVFGVSQIKIDPTFTGSSTLPEAKLTLEQRIANNVTFRYVTDVNDPNGEIIRIDWALNQQWTAIGMRDQNGIVSIKLAYKKQFR